MARLRTARINNKAYSRRHLRLVRGRRTNTKDTETMTCSLCGGYVEWKGPLVNLTHTECHGCGAINCQEVEQCDEEPDEEPDFTLDDLEWAETYPELCED